MSELTIIQKNNRRIFSVDVGSVSTEKLKAGVNEIYKSLKQKETK